jgi:hypothetical protein
MQLYLTFYRMSLTASQCNTILKLRIFCKFFQLHVSAYLAIMMCIIYFGSETTVLNWLNVLIVSLYVLFNA